ncbi:MAG TPA: polymer-forming cytoskeletal protein [Tepidisphaeraceae bacterium]|nr:polymer-forming cytoskeletal protein [Tepidisphaeraceae bacterium]
MREERGNISGNLVISEPFTLWGSIAGDVTAAQGAKFYVRGAIYGNLIVTPGGRVHVFGNISGDLTVAPKAKVIHSGILGGDALNNGGRLYIDATAKVLGKVKTYDGETTIEPQAQVSRD